ncbi:PHP domain-containing protein [Sphingomonas sp. Sphisp140]|uniref:PHP domain-containing protein n=1 Tax=unclassified Sphingomonas TaxID=196159 RepID=UPI0039AEC0D1
MERKQWLGMGIGLLAVAPLLAMVPAAARDGDGPAIPPVASLSDGIWMKGDLHLHSRHSKESTNNPESKIIGFAEKNGFDFLAITDHDNHVLGDVAHHTWADPEFKSDKVVLLYGAEWTTDRGHGNVFSAVPYDHQRLFDVRDARDARSSRSRSPSGSTCRPTTRSARTISASPTTSSIRSRSGTPRWQRRTGRRSWSGTT